MPRIQTIPPDEARGLVAKVYGQVRRDFGVVAAPMVIHSPVPELLAGAWCCLREILLVGRVPRVRKEVVAVAVSRANDCAFCIDAHGLMLRSAGEGRTARALEKPDRRATDRHLGPVARWAEATRRPGDPLLREPPFPAEDVPEMLGTASCFHYVNRVVTVLGDESPLPPRARGWLRQPMLWSFARLFRQQVRAQHEPESSFELMEPGELPEESVWARGNPVVAGALGRWWRAVREAARSHLSQDVQGWSRERMNAWHGEEPPLGLDWLEEATRELGADRPVGRLVLLAAQAPHRVSEADVESFRSRTDHDAALVTAVCWGSALAALRISTWLAGGPGAEAEADISRPAMVGSPSS